MTESFLVGDANVSEKCRVGIRSIPLVYGTHVRYLHGRLQRGGIGPVGPLLPDLALSLGLGLGVFMVLLAASLAQLEQAC